MTLRKKLRAPSALGLSMLACIVIACGGREEETTGVAEDGSADSANRVDAGRDGPGATGGSGGTGGTGGASGKGGVGGNGGTARDSGVPIDSPFVCPITSTELGRLNGSRCTNVGQSCAACRDALGGYRTCSCSAGRWACSDSNQPNPMLGCPARDAGGGTGGSGGTGGAGGRGGTSGTGGGGTAGSGSVDGGLRDALDASDASDASADTGDDGVQSDVTVPDAGDDASDATTDADGGVSPPDDAGDDGNHDAANESDAADVDLGDALDSPDI